MGPVRDATGGWSVVAGEANDGRVREQPVAIEPADLPITHHDPEAHLLRVGPFVPLPTPQVALDPPAALVAFLVRGEGKREILARVLAGDETLPAARVQAEETVVLADEAAAPN